ncbi:pyridoxamine 5'-phosphate oxidase-domain-containing protein [Spinellus fusiger]|nr:pyridoxamine 5'-phosphate oxidase-domain-containing protein [Spinellus fusiger]
MMFSMHMCTWLALLLSVVGATTTYQDVSDAAKLARQVVRDASLGTLATIAHSNLNNNYTGYPFSIMEYYSVECSRVGDPILFMSDLQVNTRNMLYKPSVSLAVRALKDYHRGNSPSPIQQPRLSLLGQVEKLPDSMVGHWIDVHCS